MPREELADLADQVPHPEEALAAHVPLLEGALAGPHQEEALAGQVPREEELADLAGQVPREEELADLAGRQVALEEPADLASRRVPQVASERPEAVPVVPVLPPAGWGDCSRGRS